MPETFRDAGRSDHWAFWQQGYPALMVTDTADFRYSEYHEPGDTPTRSITTAWRGLWLVWRRSSWSWQTEQT